VYFAEPNGLHCSIFPFESNNAGYGTLNGAGFQYLMYRQLYWFGQIKSSSPAFDQQLSPASAPTSPNGGKTVVTRPRGWKFSNGPRVDAQSAIFWMNMLMAEPSQSGGNYWTGFPSDVRSYSAPNGPRGDVVTITFDKRYSTASTAEASTTRSEPPNQRDPDFEPDPIPICLRHLPRETPAGHLAADHN